MKRIPDVEPSDIQIFKTSVALVCFQTVYRRFLWQLLVMADSGQPPDPYGVTPLSG
jgi:hypothetical protein